MLDIFEDRSSSLESPAYDAAPITPDDGNDLPIASRAVYIGTPGDLAATLVGGATVTFRNVPAGILPLRIARVLATGTTAADLVAVW